MMARRRRGVFDYDTLSPNLKELLPRVDAAVDLVFDKTVADAATYARLNAPWTDRTGNARNGLMADHDKEDMVWHRLTVYHTMPYGYWLEIRWSGRYAIIGPTLVHIAQDLAKDLATAINRAVRERGRS